MAADKVAGFSDDRCWDYVQPVCALVVGRGEPAGEPEVVGRPGEAGARKPSSRAQLFRA